MIYFVLYINNNHLLQIIRMYQNKEDALMYILKDYISNKLNNSQYYVVEVKEDKHNLENLLNRDNTFYQLKCKSNKHYLSRHGNPYDVEAVCETFFNKLQLLNRLNGMTKDKLYKLYKQTFMKDHNKFLIGKKWLILKLYNYSINNEIELLLQ